MAWSFRSRHTELANLLESARRGGEENVFWTELQEGLDEGHIKGEDFSFRMLFESLVPDGRELVESWNPYGGGPGTTGQMALMEAGSAVRSGDFANITGQILFNKVLDAYNDPAFIGGMLSETVPTRLNGEKIPGIAEIGDKAESIGEGDPYPYVGVSEEYIETPETDKKGMIIEITKEALFFDRTGRILDRAGRIGYWLGVNKEKRILDLALGINNSYKRGGTSIDTYGDNSAPHTWDNLAASNALADWSNIETAMLLFDAITDWTTAEPIMITPKTLVVPSDLVLTARRIVRAIEVQHVDNQANAATIRTRSANPLDNYEIVTSQYVKDRTSSATTWFFGDFKKSFAYMENWPITHVVAPPNNEQEFTRDIVHREKVSERGVPAVMDPKFVAKCTA